MVFSGLLDNASDIGMNYLFQEKDVSLFPPLELKYSTDKYVYPHNLLIGGLNVLCSLLNLSVLRLCGKVTSGLDGKFCSLQVMCTSHTRKPMLSCTPVNAGIPDS